MGFKTEINYILKCSTKEEGKNLRDNIKVGSEFIISKSGNRTYVLNSPIMIADDNWMVLGMCLITEAKVSSKETKLTAKILTVFDSNESKIVSKVISEAEALK